MCGAGGVEPVACPNMAAPLRSIVPATADGRTLLDWLVARFRYLDADGWSAAIHQGQLQRNDARAHADDVLATGDTIAYRPPAAAPAAVPIPLLHCDPDLLAVDKPPHLVVQEGTAFPGISLPIAIARQWGEVVPGPLEPVHRLDRETSGTLVFARHPAAARACQRQFEAGTVHKEYVAVVHGAFPAGSSLVEAPIGPATLSRIAARRTVVAAGSRGARAARTTFELLQHLDGASLVRAVPHTGRTHQIRVHLEHLGHPLLGDKMYGQSDAVWLDYTAHLKRDGDPRWPAGAVPGRQLLHAERLQLRQPSDGTPLDLRAPWPVDLRAVVAGRGGSAG